MCPERRAKASFRVPATELAYKGLSGAQVGRRIVETWRFAFDDPFRAVTHNKGIMNGIDAVAVATGQDWRAIEVGAHAYSTAGLGTDVYAPLSAYSWHVPEGGMEEEGWLEGVLEMPISCGTVGGAVASHPSYALCHSILGFPDASRLSQIIAAVGLAQNLAAIRAMATEGIQRGHMSLHARNVAVTALGGPDAVSALNAGPAQGEGTRRLEMIASHMAESGASVSVVSPAMMDLVFDSRNLSEI
jgi:degradative hydroxymethylglutaryl-CoA reductase